MSQEEKGYELLARGAAASRQQLSIPAGSPEEDTVAVLLQRGLLATVTGDNEEHVVALTRQGVAVLAAARAQGVSRIDVSSGPHIHQTNHGPSYNQFGNSNTMNVTLTQTGNLPQQLSELRELLKTLPEDDREEAEGIVTNAEKAAGKGNFERVTAYLTTLLTIGSGSVELVKKIREVIGGG